VQLKKKVRDQLVSSGPPDFPGRERWLQDNRSEYALPVSISRIAWDQGWQPPEKFQDIVLFYLIQSVENEHNFFCKDSNNNANCKCNFQFALFVNSLQ